MHGTLFASQGPKLMLLLTYKQTKMRSKRFQKSISSLQKVPSDFAVWFTSSATFLTQCVPVTGLNLFALLDLDNSATVDKDVRWCRSELWRCARLGTQRCVWPMVFHRNSFSSIPRRSCKGVLLNDSVLAFG